jgi:sterol desaturase/sphingolipid hydroxylase (fatty acid hydroxylase superfamily)
VDKQTYLIILLVGQLALVLLDIRERYRIRRDNVDAGRLRPKSIVFLVGVGLVYGGLQYGGLALVPNAEQLLDLSRAFTTDLFGVASGSVPITLIIATGIAGFYFAGLCDYLFHRFASHSRPLWFSHENHHLTTDVSAFMPGLCVRPFAVVIVFPTSAVAIFAVQMSLGAMGQNSWDMMPMLYAVIVAQGAVLGITHTAFMRRCWWLHRLLQPFGITTPKEHWLHHTSDLECNYGNFTIVWDRVFGTYVDPESVNLDEHRAGLSYDQDFLGAITLGRLKLPLAVRDRFQLDQFCYLGDKPHALQK